MRKSTVLFIISMMLILGCQKKSTSPNKSIIGNWNYINNTNRQNYSLTLESKNDTVKGTHCFVANNGNKIDCEHDTGFTMICTTNNGIYTGTFKSSYSNKKYDLTIRLSCDTLFWNLSNYDHLFFNREMKFVKEKD